MLDTIICTHDTKIYTFDTSKYTFDPDMHRCYKIAHFIT